MFVRMLVVSGRRRFRIRRRRRRLFWVFSWPSPWTLRRMLTIWYTFYRCGGRSSAIIIVDGGVGGDVTDHFFQKQLHCRCSLPIFVNALKAIPYFLQVIVDFKQDVMKSGYVSRHRGVVDGGWVMF